MSKSEAVRGRVMVVTGAASGIGKRLGEVLYEQGAKVLVTDVEGGRLEEITRNWDPVRGFSRVLDVRRADEWRQTLDAVEERFGPVEVLFNIAGIIEPCLMHESDTRRLVAQMEINAIGTMLGSQEAARRMVKCRRGHIVNMGSLASLAPGPGLAVYCASKFAVRGFSLAIAQELAPFGIAVTCVCPDAVATPMLDYETQFEEAALTFTGTILAPEQVVDRIVHDVLFRRPLELAIPWHRGLLCKLATVWPSLQMWLGPMLRRRGKLGMERYLERQGNSENAKG